MDAIPPSAGSPLTPAVPVFARLLLGARLERLRTRHGITRQRAGRTIGASESKLSRLERGRCGCKTADVEALLDLYAVTDTVERGSLLALAEQANISPWWQTYHDIIPAWTRHYLEAEQSAHTIRTYEIHAIPGLLQTPDYARALIRLGHPDAARAEIDRRIELRLRRQQILHRPDPPKLWAIIDESVLHRIRGDAAVMRGQIKHLIEMSSHAHVAVQILPFGVGGHPAAACPISIVRLPGHEVPDVVYLEQLDSAVYPDKPDKIQFYWGQMNRLTIAALPPEASRTALQRRLTPVLP